MALAESRTGIVPGWVKVHMAEMAARCGQEVAWHGRTGRKASKGDLVEELVECMTHLYDRVERKPSGAGTNSSLLMKWGNTCLWWWEGKVPYGGVVEEVACFALD